MQGSQLAIGTQAIWDYIYNSAQHSGDYLAMQGSQLEIGTQAIWDYIYNSAQHSGDYLAMQGSRFYNALYVPCTREQYDTIPGTRNKLIRE